MYLNHFGLNELPFRITPHTDFFFAGANRGATLEALLYAITNDEGIVKVSGEVGSGKTMLCRVLMERLPQQVQTILLSNPSLSRDEIFYAIAEELDIRPQSERISVLLLKLQEHLINLYGENQRVVLLIDEAHAMPPETLEQIRLLSNLESSHAKLLQIVLFGQPELDQNLSMPKMRPLKERITHSFRLEPLLRPDIEAYLDFRMRAAGYRGPSVFTPEAVRRIVRASKGLTRRVNILADKSLLAAFADNRHGISARHVDRAIRDAEYQPPALNKTKIGLAAGGVAAGLALAFGLQHLRSASAPPVAEPAAIRAPQPQPAAATPVPATAAPAGAGAAPVAAGAKPAPSGTTTVPADVDAKPAGAAPGKRPARPDAIGAKTGSQIYTPPLPATQPAPLSAPQTRPEALTSSVSVALHTNPAAASIEAGGKLGAATLREEPAMATTINAEPVSQSTLAPPPPKGRLTRERFAATQQLLEHAPSDHYSIQLLMAGPHDLGNIEYLLAHAAGMNLKLSDFYVYSVKVNDRQYYRLAYGLYPPLAEVRSKIKGLPPVYRRFAPFRRSVERMRSMNRQ